MYQLKKNLEIGAGWDAVSQTHLDRVSVKPTLTVMKNLPEGGNGLHPFCFFSDGVVLQRNACTRIFGTADYEGGAAAEIDGVLYYGKAEGGKFEIWLPPMKVGTGKTLVIYGETNRVTVRDVCVGEVILFSGQSNMEYPTLATAICWGPSNLSKQFLPYYKVTETPYIPDEEHDPETYPQYVPNEALSEQYKADANAELSYDPMIRLMLVRDQYPDPKDIAKNDEAMTYYEKPMTWKKGDDKDAVMHASMVGYLFSQYLRRVVDVPVGAVMVAVGATETGTWVSRETYFKDRSIYSVQTESHEAANSISSCYNTLVAPLIPYTFGSFIWYQGEGECASPNYVKAFKSMVDSYRADMDNPDMKALVISLPRFCMNAKYPEGYDQSNYGSADPYLAMTCSCSDFGRANQRKIPDAVENCAASVSVNAGDFDDIHPPVKQPIAMQALCTYLTAFYGFTDPSLFYPEVTDVRKENGDLVITLKNVGEGISVENRGVGFEVSDDGEHYRQYFGEKDGTDTVRVRNVGSGAKYLRYGWLEFPRVTRVDMTKYVSVFNSYGLPLDQFERTLED